jgi:hypothetical protein
MLTSENARGEGLYSTCTLRQRLCQAKLRGHLTEELCQTAIIMSYQRRALHIKVCLGNTG